MRTDSWRGGRRADPEEGQTTSPPVQTRPLSPQSAKTSLVSSPSPKCAPNPTLDRSQSAPACLPHTPPQVVTASGPSQSHHPSQGLNAPPPPIPVTLHKPDLEALPLDPPPPTADPSPPHLPTPAPLDPLFTSAPKVSVSTENSEGLAPTAMEVGMVAGGDGTGSSVLPPLPHAGASPPQMRQEVGELRATDAKNMPASISGEQEEVEEEEEEERCWVGRDSECGEHPCMAPLDPALQLNPGLHEENLASEPLPGSEASSDDLPMETAINPQAAPQAERDQPEGSSSQTVTLSPPWLLP
ncbi:hypothetical protein GJAV_G00178340 [Gymnothorax javanicus]|nr:hypothetical protein GJAV_G00178340 [Gymnothorax javanicus]